MKSQGSSQTHSEAGELELKMQMWWPEADGVTQLLAGGHKLRNAGNFWKLEKAGKNSSSSGPSGRNVVLSMLLF